MALIDPTYDAGFKLMFGRENVSEGTQNVAFTTYREIFRRLENVGNIAALSPEDRRSYEADLKFVRDRKRP